MYADISCNFRRQKCNHERSRKDSKIEIQRMWNVKTKVIPVITGATGTISKSFKKYLSNIPGNNKSKLHTHLGSTNVKALNIQHGK